MNPLRNQETMNILEDSFCDKRLKNIEKCTANLLKNRDSLFNFYK